MTRKKLLHIITGLNTGGAERALYSLLYGGLAEQFDCHVISLMDEGAYGAKIRALGVPVTCISMRRGMPAGCSLIKLWKIVREFSPDIIQGWMYHGNLAAAVVKKTFVHLGKLVWNVRHSLYDIKMERIMTRQVIRFNRLMSFLPVAILYNSRVSRSQHESFGFNAELSMVIPNGIDVDTFGCRHQGDKDIMERLGISHDAFVIGHIARLHPMKDHANFIQAAVLLARKMSHVCFVMCGRRITSDNIELVEQIPNDLRSRFLFMGEQENIAEMFGVMNVFVSSSYGEGFPNVIGEAMACERPCVVTDVGDSAYIVGDTGVVVPPKDSEALAQGIEELILIPSSERKALGKRARARIVEHFSLQAIVKRYIDLYESLLH